MVITNQDSLQGKPVKARRGSFMIRVKNGPEMGRVDFTHSLHGFLMVDHDYAVED